MDQNRNQPQDQSNQKAKQWDGNDRRMGMPDRRQQNNGQRPNRNTAADTRMMNEGSSR
jgi:hypothetical protein